MERQFFNWLCLVILCVILVVVVIVLMRPCPVLTPCPDPCPGVSIEKADHWLVIHDKLTTSGTPWTDCVSTSTTDDIAFLPNCLDVKKGDTVGIANYSNEDLIVKHASSLDAPNPISIPSRQTMVFTVIVEDDQVLLEIVGDASHGGPGMIVEP